jgi:hypothetical protein
VDRNEKAKAGLAREYAKGTPLAKARKIVAKRLGENPDGRSLLGFDSVYFRLAGLDAPLTKADGSALVSPDARALRAATKRRRDAGVRWETLAASIEATIGRAVSVSEARALYAKAGGDLDASYTGRGTREGAKATRGGNAVAVEATLAGDAS